ncbi:MAG: LysM peptidoglycan-binding domain-containing protein [Candidatus Omnitrophota bacterium]
MRNYTKEEPRKDLDISGNQGYVAGKTKDQPRENRLGNTRTISVLEVEFDSPEASKAKKTGEIESTRETEVIFSVEEMAEAAEVISEPEAVDIEETRYYTIQKNDTLQKISHKFYGTTKEWNFLYEANKDVLKSPDRLYPGVEIKILPKN